jgi:serine/threonine-protein kinase RsbW
MNNAKVELIITARLENLSVIADLIEATMQRWGLEKGTYAVQTAVDEACTNIIDYAYGDGEGQITLSLFHEGPAFGVTIHDQGKPFDPNTVPPPDLDSDLDNRRIGGLGIYFMKQLMDEVDYKFDKNGNTLTMKKYFPQTKRDKES